MIIKALVVCRYVVACHIKSNLVLKGPVSARRVVTWHVEFY